MLIKRRQRQATIPIVANLHPVLQRIFEARQIHDPSQLDKRLQALLPFHELLDIDKACVRLEKALRQHERILIVGDFDADGATSTAVAVSGLRAMGASEVSFLVPNRFEFGYGLTPAIIDVAKKWQPDLIITVDNGISSVEGVDAANEANIDVIITDHHLPGEQLPNACAIINPNQFGDSFASKSIAGVGVIFYTLLALRRHLVQVGWFESQGMPEVNMSQFLDLVALGTVADVVALDQNNRILVNQGLTRIRKGLARPGIVALLEIAGKRTELVRETDLGYAVAPRLNAAGRLDDMSLGIECLLSADLAKARLLAKQLDELNVERRKIEAEMKEQAMLALNKLSLNQSGEDALPVALCLADPAWHQGVIGILAGRLKDRYHRPVIVFALVGEEELKGSARSIPGLNIRDVLATINKDHPSLITKFGGHAMAAGLSLHQDHFETFQALFVAEVGKQLAVSQCTGEKYSDGPLMPAELNLALANLIQEAGPWGQQFPEPMFDNVFEVLDQRIVGQHHLKLTLVLQGASDSVDAIAFNVDLNVWPHHRARHIHALYKLDINTYQGRSRLQLIVEALEEAAVSKEASLEIEDAVL